MDTDVEGKSVVVEADDSVAPQLMLEKLEKVRERVAFSEFMLYEFMLYDIGI